MTTLSTTGTEIHYPPRPLSYSQTVHSVLQVRRRKDEPTEGFMGRREDGEADSVRQEQRGREDETETEKHIKRTEN